MAGKESTTTSTRIPIEEAAVHEAVEQAIGERPAKYTKGALDQRSGAELRDPVVADKAAGIIADKMVAEDKGEAELARQLQALEAMGATDAAARVREHYARIKSGAKAVRLPEVEPAWKTHLAHVQKLAEGKGLVEKLIKTYAAAALEINELPPPTERHHLAELQAMDRCPPDFAEGRAKSLADLGLQRLRLIREAKAAQASRIAEGQALREQADTQSRERLRRDPGALADRLDAMEKTLEIIAKHLNVK